MAISCSPCIPVVDIAPFTTPSTTLSARRKAAQELAEKCAVNGCLAITGHGITPELLQQAFGLAKSLFNLPIEDKMKAPHPAGMTPHRGYSAPGKERAFQKADHDASDAERRRLLQMTQDWKESYEVGDDANEKDYNIWLPEETLPGFRSQSTSIFQRLRQLSFAILEAMLMGIGAVEEERDSALNVHSGPVSQLRFLHYLTMESDGPDGQVMTEVSRLPAHTDWCSFTLSFQDNTGGLEFKDIRSGTFMPAVPRSDAVYLNVGDMMERLSNGFFPACTHRVVLPKGTAASDTAINGSDIKRVPERYAIIYFQSLREDAMIAPLASRVTVDGGAKFESSTFQAYKEQRMKWHYQGYQKDD
ncbi:MAG: hypothetical protein Q9214_004594 [Letrouitia sp. 1 TL-2023]